MCHPKNKILTQDLIDENPFLYMKISDTSILDNIIDRSACPKCFKSRKYFCYTCYVPVNDLKDKIPVVKLPFKIDIIKHKHEIDGKSTATHAAILAPHDVTIYTYPDIPEYENTTNTVLIFPSNNSLSIEQFFLKQLNSSNFKEPHPTPLLKGYNRSTLLKNRLIDDDNAEATTHHINLFEYNLDNLPIERAVFIDSTWNQSKGIYKDARIKKLQSVVLQNRVSQFWRHQKNSPRWYLATIEAIHQFAVEMHINAWGYNMNYTGLQYIFHDMRSLTGKERHSSKSYCGQYDNLLYFFKYMHEKIHTYYSHMDLQAYKRTM